MRGTPILHPTPEYLAESKVTLVNTFYSLPIGLEILSTFFRLWVRSRKANGGRLQFDDYLMVWATIVAVGVCVVGLSCGPPYGLGRHVEAVPEKDKALLLIGDYVFSHFYNMAIGFTKLSVIALYYRVFPTKPFRYYVVGTAIFVSAWIVVMEVTLGLGCRPIQAWWGAAKGECINKVSFTYFTNITNLVADLWIFTMPIPVLLRLQASLEKRLGLVFLFSVGLLICVVSAARLTLVVSVGNYDFTWHIAGLGVLSAWEPCGGILCANLPLVYRDIANLVRGVIKSFNNLTGRSTILSKSSRRKAGPYQHWRDLGNSETTLTGSTKAFADSKTERFSGETEMLPYSPVGVAL